MNEKPKNAATFFLLRKRDHYKVKQIEDYHKIEEAYDGSN